jgi:hypothetical protein
MKTSEAFCFHDGSLTVKMTGYDDADGSGYIAFNDEALDYEPHEEDSGTTRFQNVSKDDLVALRDFLNRVFPDPAGDHAIRAVEIGEELAKRGLAVVEAARQDNLTTTLHLIASVLDPVLEDRSTEFPAGVWRALRDVVTKIKEL